LAPSPSRSSRTSACTTSIREGGVGLQPSPPRI
jgi:hypothetical protein